MEGQIVKIIRQTHIVNCDNENYAPSEVTVP